VDLYIPGSADVAVTYITKHSSVKGKTGMREILSSAAKLLVDGTRCPGRIWPSLMALRNQSYNCRYIGVFVRQSSAIGGRKLAGTRFIRDRL
jgi:hypothetical protein